MLMLPKDDPRSFWAKVAGGAPRDVPNADPRDYWTQSRGSYAAVEDRVEDQYLTYSGPHRPESGLLERVHSEFTVIRSDLEDALRRLQETENELDRNNRELMATRSECEEQTTALLQAEGRMAAAQRETRATRAELATCRDSLADVNEKLAATADQLAREERENANLQDHVAEKTAQNNRLDTVVEECQRDLDYKTVQLTTSYGENSDLRTELRTVNNARSDVERERDDVRQELRVMTNKMDATMDELTESQAAVAECKNGKLAELFTC